jgi:hypothetical protein
LIVAGAMAARDLSPRFAASAAVLISMLITGLTWYYYRLNVTPPVAAGYGLYVGAVCGISAAVCSFWAAVAAMTRGGPLPRLEG